MSDEIRGSVSLSWMYPNIYPEKGPLDAVRLSLYHVRAANSIAIEYDGDRDGYVIRMDRTRDVGGGPEVVEEGVEVAFIPAWLE